MSDVIKTAVIIGTGNVAWHIGRALYNREVKILQVVGRSANSAQDIATELYTSFTTNFVHVNQKADIYIVSVSDDAIPEICAQLKLSNQLVVHTSGSTPQSVFEGHFKNYGVLYPFQTFSKYRQLDFSHVPLFIESNSPENQKRLSELAGRLSHKTFEISSGIRSRIHLAAVFACNFSNHMYKIAEYILSNENIDFSVIMPLINETVAKLSDMKPGDAQTGPAIRNDKYLMEKHLKMLEKEPLLKEIYGILSSSIQHKMT